MTASTFGAGLVALGANAKVCDRDWMIVRTFSGGLCALTDGTLRAMRAASIRPSNKKRMTMTPKLIRSLVAITILAAFAFVTTPSFSHDVKMPQTVEDHTAMAKQYQDKAAANRTDAADHRAMAAAYSKGVPKDKQGPNPWSTRMNKHCEALAISADYLAVDEEKAAEYHNLRAKEPQGK